MTKKLIIILFKCNNQLLIKMSLDTETQNDTFSENVKINKSHMMIKEETFRDKQDIAYLLALDGTKSGEIMRSGNENEIWKYLENYAYLGCEEINKWIFESPIDELYDVVLNKIMEAAIPLADNQSI